MCCLLVYLRPLASQLFASALRRERRQKIVNIDAMASSFDALPPEMVQKCVEFLDFDLVSRRKIYAPIFLFPFEGRNY